MCESSRKSREAKSALKAEEEYKALRTQLEKKEEKKTSVENNDGCCEPLCPEACG